MLLAPVALLPHSAGAATGGGSVRSGLPAALSAGNQSGPLITPAQAVGVVEALWPLRETALANDDIATTDRLEDGVAREFDDAVSAFDRHIPTRAR